MEAQARSREALASFLDYLADKGLMEKNTVAARKAAVTKVLGILDDVEATDVTNLDVEDVVSRFHRLHGHHYTPGSLTTYKGRLRAVLDDFRSYLENPLAFRPAVQRRTRVRARTVNEDQPEPAGRLERRGEQMKKSVPMPAAAGLILPIPIRPDLTIHIQGLPFDLTEAEARKIAAVVTAMVQARSSPLP